MCSGTTHLFSALIEMVQEHYSLLLGISSACPVHKERPFIDLIRILLRICCHNPVQITKNWSKVYSKVAKQTIVSNKVISFQTGFIRIMRVKIMFNYDGIQYMHVIQDNTIFFILHKNIPAVSYRDSKPGVEIFVIMRNLNL